MKTGTPLEHVVDVTAGSAVDRDYEGTPPPSQALLDAHAGRKRDRALARLRAVAELKDHPQRMLVSDLLTVLGLSDD